MNRLSRHLAPWSVEERDRLKFLRLEQDWTFKGMASLIGLSEATLRQILEREDLEAPHDRTVFKIRRWLEEFNKTRRTQEASR